MEKKRILILSDEHGGHHAGLTPPPFQSAMCGDKSYRLQVALWDEFKSAVDRLKPIDCLVNNGDAIDGKGKRSGSTELIQVDRRMQCEITAEAINYCEPRVVKVIRGTPYHTGDGEDWEDVLFDMVKRGDQCGIYNQYWMDVYGVVFDFKHFVSSSSIPHGRFTALAKDNLWNTIWHNEHEQQPDADILIRSHVHYHVGCFDPTFLAMTTPALQAAETKFGAKKCSGVVHWGFVWFDVYEDGSYTWNRFTKVLELQKARSEKLL